jgi:hypothetical protein
LPTSTSIRASRPCSTRPTATARSTARFSGARAGATDSNWMAASLGTGEKSARAQLVRWKSLRMTSSSRPPGDRGARASTSAALLIAACTSSRSGRGAAVASAWARAGKLEEAASNTAPGRAAASSRSPRRPGLYWTNRAAAARARSNAVCPSATAPMLRLASSSTTRTASPGAPGDTSGVAPVSGRANAHPSSSTAAARSSRTSRSRSRYRARRCAMTCRTNRTVDSGIRRGRGLVSQWIASGSATANAPTAMAQG